MKKILESFSKHKLIIAIFIFASGIALYFGANNEPQIRFPFIISILCFANFIIFRKHLLSGIFLIMFGFFYTCGFAQNIGTPILQNPQRNTEIIGTIKDIDFRSDKTRVFIKTNTGSFRLTLGKGVQTPSIGDEILATATIFPMNSADAPGTFDFARWAYFNKISGSGYITKLKITKSQINDHDTINNLRQKIHDSAKSKLVDSLVLGYKNPLSETENNVWKASGVNHVFSISGFHMTLVGGWLILIFYFIFRSIPQITRRIPARFPSIICAAICLYFYLQLSGNAAATQRAFLMTALATTAFLFGRNLLSLRSISIVAGALLVFNPHYLLDAGFQLSFAAVFGLAWFFENSKYIKRSFITRTLRAIAALFITSIIAMIFTAPFVMYNFHNLPIYGIVGNLIFIPIFSILIMPLAIIGSITALIGFHLPLDFANNVYNWCLVIAQNIANFPFSQIQTPIIPSLALGIIIIGFICLMLLGDKKKIGLNYGLFFISVILATSITLIQRKPIFYTTGDHELVGFMTDSGKLRFNKTSSSEHFFAFNTWQSINFEPINNDKRPQLRRGFAGEKYYVKCNGGSCIYTTPNWTLAYTQKFMPVLKNLDYWCKHNDFIVSVLDIYSPNCNAKIPHGGFVIYENGEIKFVPNRLWHNQR